MPMPIKYFVLKPLAGRPGVLALTGSFFGSTFATLLVSVAALATVPFVRVARASRACVASISWDEAAGAFLPTVEKKPGSRRAGRAAWLDSCTSL